VSKKDIQDGLLQMQLSESLTRIPGIMNLSTIKNIEVRRGPFSSLYGNSSGGVSNYLQKMHQKQQKSAIQ
jgi:outer membrane receptor for ferrienterochelin and colicin